MFAASELQGCNRVVSSMGQVGADPMEWVTQRPADTVELFSTSERKMGGGRRRWRGR